MAHAMKYAQCRLCVPTIDQVASAALYDVGPEYFAAVRDEYKRRRDTVMRKLKEIPGVVCECPKGAFYIFVDVSGTGLNGDDFAARLLEEKYVGIVPGSKLGKGFDKYVRLSYATSDENLEEALKRMAELAAAL